MTTEQPTAPPRSAPGKHEPQHASDSPDRIAPPFDLQRWFFVAAFLAMTLLAIGLDLTLRYYIRAVSFDRDAELSAQFVASLLRTESHHAALPEGLELVHILDPRVRKQDGSPDVERIDSVAREFFDHIGFLPDILLANVFARDGTVIWSSNPKLIGRLIDNNEELAEAFKSRTMVAHGHINTRHDREEQAFLGEPEDFYLENYIPLPDRSGQVPVVVELYKEPKSVLAAMAQANRVVSITVALGSIVAFLVLSAIVRRGARQLQAQQRRLVESESLVMMGELSRAVAHGLRNPLSAIRTSAELALDNTPERAQKNSRDIISQTDRLSALVSSLLAFAGPIPNITDPVDILKVADETLVGFGTQIARAGIRVSWVLPPAPRPIVQGQAALLAQAISSVLANAVEAMPDGGHLRVLWEVHPDRDALELIICDTGVGMDAAQLAMAFRPFHTTKRHGFGVGLPIARRILERFGGSIEIESVRNHGTFVHLFFYLHD